MLRDDLEIALNDLIVALREAADAYDTAAQIVGTTDSAALFKRGREEYRRHAERLEDEQRRLGHLPKEPDAEVTLLHEAVSYAKAGLSDDELAALLVERRAQEEHILASAGAALDLELPERLRHAVTAVEQQATGHLATLDALGAGKHDKG